jgi:hypothetical protein
MENKIKSNKFLPKHILKEGEIYHCWTVVQPGSQYTVVKCKCGDMRTMRNWNIINKSPGKCKKCYHDDTLKQSLIPVGTTLGNWTVISEKYERKNSKTGGLKQEVRCKCGLKKFLELYQLKIGKTKQCLECASKSRIETYKDLIPLTYVKRIQYEATQRDLEYSITLKDLYIKYTEQQGKCAISGIELQMPVVNLYRYEKGKTFLNSKNFTASLDRIDSSKGYVVGNVQWVHKDINKLKMDLPEERFFQLIKEIYEFKQLDKVS